MDKLFTFALAIAVCVGTTVMLAHGGRASQSSQGKDALLAADGAFRDGIYLGTLAAESGRQLPAPIGRWASEKDRESFAEGYRRGYGRDTAPAQAQNR